MIISRGELRPAAGRAGREGRRLLAAGAREGPCGCPLHGARCERVMRQTLEGSFSAVSKPNFARKYAIERSRRDLHNALRCTALRSQLFIKILLTFARSSKISKIPEIFESIFENFGKIENSSNFFLNM